MSFEFFKKKLKSPEQKKQDDQNRAALGLAAVGVVAAAGIGEKIHEQNVELDAIHAPVPAVSRMPAEVAHTGAIAPSQAPKPVTINLAEKQVTVNLAEKRYTIKTIDGMGGGKTPQ